MGGSKETLAEELMKELIKRISDNANLLQGWGKAFQAGARGTLLVDIQLVLRGVYAD